MSTVCDHIMIISKGKLVASDSPEGLQKLMVKSVEIEVTALGEKEKAEQILSQVEHIESFTFEEANEENAIKVRIVTEDNMDIRKELSITLTNGDMPVLSMNRVEQSLEDIFLQLTGDNDAEVETDKLDENEEVFENEEEVSENEEEEETDDSDL